MIVWVEQNLVILMTYLLILTYFGFRRMEFDGYYYLMQDLTALDELPYRLVKKEGLIDGHYFQSPFSDIKFMHHNVLVYKAKIIRLCKNV